MTTTGKIGGAARLRWLLIAIITFAVLPVFALSIARLQESSERAIADARELAIALALRGAEAQTALVGNARSLAEAIRHIPAVSNHTAECTETLARINKDAPWASSLFLLDLSGTVVCSSKPMAFGIDFSDRQYYKDALRTHQFVVSEAIIGRVTGNPVVAAALPIRENGGIITGVLVVGIELSWLPAISEQAKTKHDGIVLAMNRDGGLVSRLHRNSAPLNVAEIDQQTRNLIRELLGRESGSADIDGVHSLAHIFGIARTSDTGLTVAVGFDRTTVLEPITRQFRSDLAWLLGIAAASFLLALLIAEISVLRGVGVLNRAARQLKAGKIGVRVNLPRHTATELHLLSASFNSMIAEFERLAYLDRLTGLPNRRYLERHMLARSERNAECVAEALLAIDLDGFKPVNDVHGHAMGDRVLAAVARRIAAAADGKATIARLGGDEFVAVMEIKAGNPRFEARMLAEQIRLTFNDPVEIEGMSFPVGASIGIALVPHDAPTLAEALVKADAALYEAKRMGRNRVIDRSPSIAANGEDSGLLEGHWTSLELVGGNK